MMAVSASAAALLRRRLASSSSCIIPTTHLSWNRHVPGHRSLATSSSSQQKYEDDKEQQHRHTGIQVHPDSIGNRILPGNIVLRTTSSGHVQKRYTELAFGYFWMIKDLKKTGEKPILSNERLIEENVAKVFPSLTGGSVQSLSGETVHFPAHCLRKNRSRDAAAQCSLVAVSFRDFGFQQLSSWIDPFQAAVGDSDRVEVLKINVAEGWLNKYFLRAVIRGFTKRNTAVEEYDSTFLYFGDADTFRDSLRMHNVLAGYVFLLDGLGRVRFAGSGNATEEDAARLIQFAKELTPLLQPQRKFGRLAPGKGRGGRMAARSR
jgi:mitochondrial ATPase complex subunit ATP10